MDEYFAVAPPAAANLLALEIANDNIFHRDFIEAVAVRLHEEKRWVSGYAYGDMAARQVALSFRFQDQSGVDYFLLRFVQRHDVSLI